VNRLFARSAFDRRIRTESIGEFKTTVSKFHPIVFRLVGIKVYDDTLPDVIMWREVDTAAAKGEGPAGRRV